MGLATDGVSRSSYRGTHSLGGVFLLGFVLISAGGASAQSTAEADAGARQQVRAVRLSDSALEVDGRLDDPVWDTTVFVSDFQQKGAQRGFPVRDQTEIAFLYDDNALYVGARMYAADPGTINAPRSPRDDAANADRVIVSLDTYRNRQTAYNFGVTAGGTRIDYYQPEDVFLLRDYDFDPVWEARVAVDDAGWTAEMRIPFSSLEFNASSELVWGVNVQRVSPAQRMYAFWIVVPGNDPGWASRFGDLIGLDGVPSPQQLSVTPYVAAEKVVADPFPVGDGTFLPRSEENRLRYGGDVLYEITPSLALEATINPDYGQIEADPAVVNLTAFETFFPEKRPFFLKDYQLLQGRGPRYYYSRRIGGVPHGSVEGPLESEPVATTIFGAGKLVGRLDTGLSIAGLVAVTDEEEVAFVNPETDGIETVKVEPTTVFAIGRVQKDVGAGSTFGLVGTAVSRALGNEEPLAAVVPESALSGGADWNLRFAGGTHEFGGFVGGSAVTGDPAAMLRLQGSSARYYQRPDAGYVEVDPSRTLLAGYTGGVHLGRIQGPWHWTVSGEARSPGFEINDAGAMATADDLDGFAQVGYGTALGGGTWQRIDVAGSFAVGTNFGGVRQYTSPQLDLGLVWSNFWRSYLTLAYDDAVLSDSLTRGGPLMGTAPRWRAGFGFSSNDARPHVWAVDASYETDEFGSWGYSLGTRLSLRLTDHLWMAINPGIEQGTEARQFFSHIEDGRPETFGRRYVFAALDSATVFARLRARIDIRPGLGIELYAEPFLANGDYDRFGELEAAGSSALRVYGVAEGTTIEPLPDGSQLVTDGDSTFELANGDFDLQSLRSNVVFRWDYHQGSTLWLVWQQNRLVEGASGTPPGLNDLSQLFSSPAENIFAVKLSYRLDLR